MKYYPEIFELDGYRTYIPNLLHTLTLAKSWAARGYDAADPAEAMKDFRRAIRVGRLLRQEDVVVISDLVGLACIRFGAQGIYDLALKENDYPLALTASIVLGEIAPQRLMTAERVTGVEVTDFAKLEPSGKISLTNRSS
jgi:hypothetical protein